MGNDRYRQTPKWDGNLPTAVAIYDGANNCSHDNIQRYIDLS